MWVACVGNRILCHKQRLLLATFFIAAALHSFVETTAMLENRLPKIVGVGGHMGCRNPPSCNIPDSRVCSRVL